MPDGWKPDAITTVYINEIVKERKKTQSKSISTIQSASTQKILDAHARGETLVSHKEPLDPSKYLVRKENGSIDVNERPLSVQEFVNYECMRRGAKNQLGESKLSASTEERAKAIDAYLFTAPSDLTEIEKEKLTKMTKIEELKKLPKEIKKSKWFDKVFEWVFKKEIQGTHRMIDIMENKEEWEHFTKGKKDE